MENLKKEKIYAVVGASNNPEKYGYKVMKYLLNKGQEVIPVNPKEKEILGQKVYAKISEISKSVDMVIFVVPPLVTEKVLTEVASLGIKRVWMQPGRESEKAINFCQENGLECTHHACIMMKK